jgi:hypothetical protein
VDGFGALLKTQVNFLDSCAEDTVRSQLSATRKMVLITVRAWLRLPASRTGRTKFVFISQLVYRTFLLQPESTKAHLKPKDELGVERK